LEETMSQVNRCDFIGRLGNDPDLRYTPNGLAITKVSIAVNERRKVSDEWTTITTWVRITAFGKAAENVQKILGKGDLVAFSTSYKENIWETAEGKTIHGADFILSDWVLLRKRDGAANVESKDDEEFFQDAEDDETQEESTASWGTPEQPAINPDDLPF
jgi:single-strand DNA-binding protein